MDATEAALRGSAGVTPLAAAAPRGKESGGAAQYEAPLRAPTRRRGAPIFAARLPQSLRTAPVGAALLTNDDVMIDCNVALSKGLNLSIEQLLGCRLLHSDSADAENPHRRASSPPFSPLRPQCPVGTATGSRRDPVDAPPQAAWPPLRPHHAADVTATRLLCGRAITARRVCVTAWTPPVIRNRGLRLALVAPEPAAQRAEIREPTTTLQHRLGEIAPLISHELKGPLAAASNAIATLSSGLEAYPSRMLNSVQLCLNDLSKTVDALLQFCSPMEPNWQDLRLHVMLLEAADLACHGRAKERPAPDIKLAGEDTQLTGDPRLLRYLFAALLRNAAEAGPPPANIRIRTAASDRWCSVSVLDHGRGCSLSTIERVFEPFFSTKPRGLGLGLSLAMRAVQAHDGKIWLRPNPDGRGTEVVVRLPRDNPMRPRPSPQASPPPPS